MIERRPVREAPQPCPMDLDSPCHPDSSEEPLLEIAEIQGNILAGFNKDFQALVFLEIVEAKLFKDWLRELAPFVASTWEVLTFNRLFKEVRRRRGDSRALRSTWLNVAFSCAGLKKLAPAEEVGQFRDLAFQEGLWRRSKDLGDPREELGCPDNWVVGGPRSEPDVILIFASDLESDLLAEADRIERSLWGGGGSGARIVYKEKGAVLPPPRRGHEHFGFLDGISQPGVRGRISQYKGDVLTLRQAPGTEHQGKPGQDILWPGEFVFGYPSQDSRDPQKEGPDSLRPDPNGDPVAPEWARNGSYLVFRRLRQNVGAFKEFVARAAGEVGLPPEVLAAKIVGRFPSGAPILRVSHEDAKIGGDDCINNDFEFASEPGEDEFNASQRQSACQCEVNPPAEPDDLGTRCPFGGHIRKMYPRNDQNRFVSGSGEADAQKHRLIRRGIPFGPPYPVEPPSRGEDGIERGLLFLAYQTSIVGQFEHIQKQFANNVEQNPVTGEMRAGYDLIIGQNQEGPRPFVVPVEIDGGVRNLVIEADCQWVVPTGGGYYFAPSISALAFLASKEEEVRRLEPRKGRGPAVSKDKGKKRGRVKK